MKGGIKRIFELLKDYIFPLFCLGCKKEGMWVCKDCLNQIETVGIFQCPVCEKENKNGRCCDNCKTSSFLFWHIAAGKYNEDELLGKIIYQLKYQYVEEMGEYVSFFIESFLEARKKDFSSFDYIIPVPLHKRRFAERGFNQAELIAKIFSEQTNVPILDCLKRQRYTKQQARLDRDKRQKNLDNAFLLHSLELKNKKIILVDDVFTTGSTMQSCARVLKDAGAGEVVGFTLARG